MAYSDHSLSAWATILVLYKSSLCSGALWRWTRNSPPSSEKCRVSAAAPSLWSVTLHWHFWNLWRRLAWPFSFSNTKRLQFSKLILTFFFLVLTWRWCWRPNTNNRFLLRNRNVFHEQLRFLGMDPKEWQAGTSTDKWYTRVSSSVIHSNKKMEKILDRWIAR